MPDTILVVDDVESMRTLCAEALQIEGYEVVTASDGQEGFRIIRESAGKMAAVVADMMMPNMNGRVMYEVTSQIYPDLPFLFISGYPNACDWLQGEDAVRLLEKPFRLEDLIDAVRNILRR